MINRFINLFRPRTFKKSDFSFSGKIPRDLPAIFIFPEDRTPFLTALGLFYSLKSYHKKIRAVGIPEFSESFKYHFPGEEFIPFNPQKTEIFEKYRDSVIYLGSIYRDTFYNFPEICRGKFSVAYSGFDSHYNFLVDTHFETYPEFVKNFLKILGIPDLTNEFLKNLRLPERVPKNHVFLDLKNTSRFKKFRSGRLSGKILSTFQHQDTEFIGDLSFQEKLKLLSSACCLVSDDSLFTGYALHYEIPVYSENCSKYFKNPLCKELRELVK